MGVSHPAHLEDLDVPDATFGCVDLHHALWLDELGLEVPDSGLEPGRAVLACRVVEADQWCRGSGEAPQPLYGEAVYGHAIRGS